MNIGALPVTPETEAELYAALQDIREIRQLLIASLGPKAGRIIMILKASQRGNGQELAFHLQRFDQNEHMELHELRGFASENLTGAFKEVEAISRASKCQQYLFSVSLNPPQGESVGVEVFEDALERIEKRLGLEDQPRAIVFHEKENRRPAHCVWSRMDADTMTARQLSFFKTKLMGVSRDLYLTPIMDKPRELCF